MTRLTLAPFVVLLSLAAAGCSGTASEREVREQLSPGSVLLSVPNVSDEANGSCGLDCLTSLLRFHGLDIDDEGRRRFPLGSLAKEWISAGELRDYLLVRGFRASLVHGKLDCSRPTGIQYLLECGLPVIVERSIGGSNHFYLVCGVEPEKRRVFVMAPVGVGAIPYDRFEEGWAKADHLMLVAAPASKIVADAPRSEPAPDSR
jgi:ABC-type bacteriocin/lantibiotic exporter with double-glycine peptidase domain